MLSSSFRNVYPGAVRRASLFVVAALLSVIVLGPGSAGAQSTPGLAEARAAAQQAAQDYADAQAALGSLDRELTQLRAEQESAQAELDALRDQVSTTLVQQYMDAGTAVPVFARSDLNEQAKADALVELVTQSDRDAIDAFRAAEARRAAVTVEIEEKLAEQEDLVAQLEEAEARVTAEVARLEEVERQRQADEARRVAEAAQRTADEQARRSATTTVPVDDGPADQPADTTGDTPSDPTAPPTTPPPTTPPTPPPSGGGMVCPVPGSTFIDSWGAPRPQGWSHQGVDMMASSGTPIVAPVSGVVTHRGNNVGGLAFHIEGSDGRYYYGAHLSAYGASGSVSAGTVIGYVGNTGDAQYTASHLHLEIHIGGVAVNPYPYVAAVC
jgi:murein DD-endopeptidase MepM/ murein hydrolase activator NlpD